MVLIVDGNLMEGQILSRIVIIGEGTSYYNSLDFDLD